MLWLVAWIAVHRDEIACVPNELVAFDFSFASTTEIDHFVDHNKMVFTWPFGAIYRSDGSVDCCFEITPFLIA